MFPGGGAQYAGMARDLYETEPVFADWMDKGLAVLEPQLDYSIRELWLPARGAEAAANEALKKPSVQLPLIMITEYALAKLYESWGVVPAALVGHSMGENTAACIAGVMSFEDCIGLVRLRGALFRWHARRMRDYVLHTPNYILMPFEGPTATTVHDLSWIRYPETHPVERVTFMNRHMARTLEHANVVLTDSEFVAGEIASVFAYPRERIRVVPLGVAGPALSAFATTRGRPLG